MKYSYLFRYTLSNKQIKRTCNISDCPQKKNCDFCAKTRLQCFICFLFGIKSKMTKFPFLCNLALTPHCTIFLCCSCRQPHRFVVFVAISSVNLLPNFPWNCL